MGQQPVDAILLHRQLRIVEIVRVHPNAIGERREAWLHLQARTDHGGIPAEALGPQVPLHDYAAFGHRARQGQAQAVKNRLPGQFGNVIGQRRRVRLNDEFRHFAGQSFAAAGGEIGRVVLDGGARHSGSP